MFKAIWRFITFQWIWASDSVNKAADATFTSSAQGVGKAYDLAEDTMIEEFKTFQGALADVEMACETARGSKDRLDTAIAAKQKAVDGALHIAMTSQDAAEAQQAQVDGEKFLSELTALKAELAQANEDIAAQEAQLKLLETQLGQMKDKIASLPAKKAAAVAKFVSSKALKDAFDKINGIRKPSSERGPLDAVDAKLEHMAAEARVAGRMAHATTEGGEGKYVKAGEKAGASGDFAAMLAAKKAELAAQTGGAAPAADKKAAEGDGSTRPKI